VASVAQFEANRLKFGLFSARNCVRPEETHEYTKLSKALWKDLNPVGAVEQMLAVEVVRAAWRLHRCTVTEAKDGETPATQASVDRARASAHNSLRRFLSDLRQFQSDRWLRAEVLREGFDEQYYGIADAHRVIKGLAANERLKSQFFTAPIGIDPLNQTVGPASRPVEPSPTAAIQTQSAQKVGQALPVPPAVFAAGAVRTQLVGQALSPANQSQIPRNAPCPCHSGLKYKRCCDVSAPPVLTNSASAHT
jgi:hypothetical protein